MDEYIGQSFQVELADGNGRMGFRGKVVSVNGPFVVFETFNGSLIVNSAYIKTMCPRQEGE